MFHDVKYFQNETSLFNYLIISILKYFEHGDENTILGQYYTRTCF